MAVYEHLLGILAMITCAGFGLLFMIALSAAIQDCIKEEAHRQELKRRLTESKRTIEEVS